MNGSIGRPVTCVTTDCSQAKPSPESILRARREVDLQRIRIERQFWKPVACESTWRAVISFTRGSLSRTAARRR